MDLFALFVGKMGWDPLPSIATAPDVAIRGTTADFEPTKSAHDVQTIAQRQVRTDAACDCISMRLHISSRQCKAGLAVENGFIFAVDTKRGFAIRR
jgi:hypothetical protein